MEKDNGKAYSEVIEILKLLDDEKRLEALPMEMLEVLKSKADPEYKPQISSEIPLDEQNLQPETLSILSWIAMKYWNSEEENDKLFELKSEGKKEEQNEEEVKQEENEQAQEELQQQEEIKQEEDEQVQKELKQQEEIKQEEKNEQAQEELQQAEKEIEYKEDINSIEDKERKIEEINETLPIARNQMKWYEKLKMKIMEFINKLFNKNK